MNQEMRKERRGAQRIALLVRVECTTGPKSILGSCENTSEGGMLVSTSEPLEVGASVTLRLIPLLTANKSFEVAATVVRTVPGEQMALQFVMPPEGLQEALSRFRERQQAQPPA